MTTLTQIKTTIADSLQLMEQKYRATLNSPVPLVNEINEYILARSGKQIRPLLVLLAAHAGNKEMTRKLVEDKTNLAIAMEILHNSSLMHDDVVDESEMRRGRPSVRHRWSNKIAVLCGDYYLALVMNILNTVGDTNAEQVVNQTVIEMSEGELLQQQVSRNIDLSEKNYYDVIYKKTASLMATCCEIGHKALRSYGEHFGMAFQIRDDIMDYHADKETGKPQGNDIRERKMTLPMLKYLELADDKEQAHVIELLKHEEISDNEVEDLIGKVSASGAMELAANVLTEHIDKAKQALEVVEDSVYKSALKDLADQLKL